MALPINGRCRDCGAAIIWLVTRRRKKIPCDADSVRVFPIDRLYVPGVHVCHIATCGKSTVRIKEVEQAGPAVPYKQPKLL